MLDDALERLPFRSITSRSAVRQPMPRTCELLRDRGPVEILRFVLRLILSSSDFIVISRTIDRTNGCSNLYPFVTLHAYCGISFCCGVWCYHCGCHRRKKLNYLRSYSGLCSSVGGVCGNLDPRKPLVICGKLEIFLGRWTGVVGDNCKGIKVSTNVLCRLNLYIIPWSQCL